MSRREPERFKPYEQDQGQLLPSFVAESLDPAARPEAGLGGTPPT